MSLASKIAIVTGGAMGIGFAVSTDLAGRGVSVVIADAQDAAAAANRLRDEGHHAIGVKVDVSSETDTDAMAAAAVAEFGGIDILVNNAGILLDASAASLRGDRSSGVAARNGSEHDGYISLLACRSRAI